MNIYNHCPCKEIVCLKVALANLKEQLKRDIDNFSFDDVYDIAPQVEEISNEIGSTV